MPPTKHALLGASSSHRWLNCTPSARLEEPFPDTSSEAAAEGTLAHAIAETHLYKLLAGKKPATPAKLKANPLYHAVMEDYVSVYTTYLMEHYAEAIQETPDAMIMTEDRVDFSKWVPGGYGTADCIMIANGHLQIFDLKYGKGVPVEAENNPQLRLYALGALDAYDILYGVHTVTMHIIQPRLDSITSETMSAEALYDWGDTYVKPRAELASKGEGEPNPGEHCRFCKFKNACRAYAMKQLEIAQLRFQEPEHEEREPAALSPEETAQILLAVDELTRWAKSVKDFALDQAVNHGMSYPGWKVVAGRSNRVITDQEAALEALEAAGFTANAVTELKGLGALEEIVGKKKLAALLEDLIIKPAGRPVLARDTDKRPALSSFAEAQAVFTPINEEE